MTPPDELLPPPDAPPRPAFCPDWSGGLNPAAPDVPWLWHGYLAPGNITLLTSQWKSGKTTLLSVLLARRAAGGGFGGRPLKPGRTAVVSEESREVWEQRRRTLNFGDAVAFFCRPVGCRKPSVREWLGLIDSLAALGGSHGVDLAVIDPLASFLPSRCENNNDLMLAALEPLGRLRDAGLAVLLLHHPKKGHVPRGQAARGAGALSHYVDVSIEMWPYRPAGDGDRRRVLQADSRFPATPRQLVLEWAADGGDYVARGDVAEEEFREHWEQMRPFFASAPERLTRRELRALWPSGPGAPSDATLCRWLERAVAQGLLRREGTGHCGSPYRYWLPAREAEWLQDPLARLRQQAEEMQAALERQMRQPPEAPRPRARGRKGRGPAGDGAAEEPRG